MFRASKLRNRKPEMRQRACAAGIPRSIYIVYLQTTLVLLVRYTSQYYIRYKSGIFIFRHELSQFTACVICLFFYCNLRLNEEFICYQQRLMQTNVQTATKKYRIYIKIDHKLCDIRTFSILRHTIALCIVDRNKNKG